jgi:hypothetical protein
MNCKFVPGQYQIQKSKSDTLIIVSRNLNLILKIKWFQKDFNFSELGIYVLKIHHALSPKSYTHISVRDLYFSRIGLSIFSIFRQPNMWTDPGNI